MQIVYALVSDNSDYYYEQCLVSIISLKRVMNNAKVIVLVDDKTCANLVGKRQKIYDYAEVIVQKYPSELNKKIRSRLLKIQTKKLVSGNYLYIDVDTVIVEDLSSLINDNFDIAMVLDKHCMLSDNFRKEYIKDNSKKMEYSTGIDDKHFNGGVIYVNDTNKARTFFEKWEKLYWECVDKKIYIDQTSLNEANFRCGGIIKELSGEWNVQLDCGLQYIAYGKIYHYSGYQPLSKENKYYNYLPFELCEDNNFKAIKETGCLNDKTMKIISNPRRSFLNSYMISSNCIAYSIVFTNHFRVLKYFYLNHSRIFGAIEKILQKAFKIIYKRV